MVIMKFNCSKKLDIVKLVMLSFSVCGIDIIMQPTIIFLTFNYYKLFVYNVIVFVCLFVCFVRRKCLVLLITMLNKNATVS